MSEILFCDHCGTRLGEGDLASGRAVKAKGDVLCAACAALYDAAEGHRPSATSTAPPAAPALDTSATQQLFDGLPRRTRVILAFAMIGLVVVLMVAGVLVAIAVRPDEPTLRDISAPAAPAPAPSPAQAPAPAPAPTPASHAVEEIAEDPRPDRPADELFVDHEDVEHDETEAHGDEGAMVVQDSSVDDFAEDATNTATDDSQPSLDAVSTPPKPVALTTLTGNKAGWTLALDDRSAIEAPEDARPAHGYLALTCTLALNENASDVVALGPPAELTARPDEQIVVAERSASAALLWLADGQKTRSFQFNVAYQPGMTYVDSAKVDILAYRGVERLSTAWDDPANHIGQTRRMGEYAFTIRGIETNGRLLTIDLAIEHDEDALPAIYRWRVLREDGSAVTGDPTLSVEETNTAHALRCDGPRPSRLEIEMATDIESSIVTFVLSAVELPAFDAPPLDLTAEESLPPEYVEATPQPLPQPVDAPEPSPDGAPHSVPPATDTPEVQSLSVSVNYLYTSTAEPRNGVTYGTLRCESSIPPLSALIAAVEYPSFIAPETDRGVASVSYAPTPQRYWAQGTARTFFPSIQILVPEGATRISRLDAACSVYFFAWEDALKWDSPATSIGTTKTAHGISLTLIRCERKGSIVEMSWRVVMPNDDRATMLKVTQILKPGHTSGSQVRIIKSTGTAIEFSERSAFQDGPPQTTWVTMRGLTGRTVLALSAADLPLGAKQRLDPPIEVGRLTLGASMPLAPVSREIVSARGAPMRTTYSTAEAQRLVSPFPPTTVRRLDERTRQRIGATGAASINGLVAILRESAGSSTAERTRATSSADALKRFDTPEVTELLAPLIAEAKNTIVVRTIIDVLKAHDNRESARQLLALAVPEEAQRTLQGSTFVTETARTALFALSDFQSIEWLYRTGLWSRNAQRRRLSAQVLADVGEERSLPYLRKSLRDSDPSVRAASAVALGRMKDEPSVADLARLALDRTPYVRASAILALATIGGDEASRIVVLHLNDKAYGVRRAAVKACGALRTSPTIEALTGMLYNCPDQIKGTVLRSLIAIAGKHLGDNPLAWKQWWDDTKDTYSPPSITQIAAAIALVEEEGASYYGIKMYGKRIAFVIDVSGSMSGAKLDGVKSELKHTLGSLTTSHYFCLIFFETSVNQWRTSLVPATPGNISAAVSYIENLKAYGATNLFDALMMALKMQSIDTIYLLSDGQPSAGSITDVGQILDEVRRVNMGLGATINCIGLGSHDRRFMAQLAEENGGRYVSP